MQYVMVTRSSSLFWLLQAHLVSGCPLADDPRAVVVVVKARAREKVVFYSAQWSIVAGWRKDETDC